MKHHFASSDWRALAVSSGIVLSLALNVGFVPGAKADLIPQNQVQITMMGFNLTGTYSAPGGQPTGEGKFKNGNAGEYPEGACIPSLVDVKNRDNVDGDIEVTAYYDYANGGDYGILTFKRITTGLTDPKAQADDLNDFSFTGSDLGTATSFPSDDGGSVNATVVGPYSGQSGTAPVDGADTTRHYNILLQNVPKQTTVHVLFCAQLHVDASEYGGGAQMSVRTGEGGAENIAIQAVKLLVLPKLTLTKVVEGGTATPDQWSFHVSPAINGVSDYAIPAGQDSVTIDNIEPDGTYTVTESGPAGYEFKDGSGTNCVFSGSTASTTLAAAKPQQTATCVFTNRYVAPIVLPKLTVTKVVVNDNGGTAAVSDFPLFVDGNPVTSGQQGMFSTGTHAVSETGDPGYAATFSGDCDSTGQVTLAEGDIKSCTITNDDIYTATTGTLTVIKQVVNDNGGTKTAGDFTLNVTGSNVSNPSFAGSSDGVSVVLDAGSYSVDETTDAGYAKTLGANCSGTLVAGDTKTCIVTNDDIWVATTGTLTVIKVVINDDKGDREPGDFKLEVEGVSPSPASFDGSSSGTTVVLGVGDYNVAEKGSGNYDVSYGTGCSGTIAAGESRTCTVTNNDKTPGGGGGGGGGWEATTGTIMVYKTLDSAYGGEADPSDFTLAVSGTNPTPASFSGSSAGTPVTVGAGAYSVSEEPVSGYVASYGEGCIGTVAAGQTVSCYVINRYSPHQITGADLSVTKSANASTVQTGGSLDYLITLTNIGPDPATNASVSDVLPAGFIYQSSAASQGSYDSSSGVWTIGAMAVNATATLSIHVTVTAAAGLYVNTATATALEYDPVHANNVASQSVTVATSGGGNSGGGTVTYIYTNPGGGGLSATSGGGATGFAPTTTPPAPVPQVLGVTDEAMALEPAPAPVPQVLGAVDELPRTGTPAWAILFVLGAAAAAMRRQR